MNPARAIPGRSEDVRANEEELAKVQPAESRSWEPPCWPSDDWDAPVFTRRRAIGWRGLRTH